MAHQCSVCLKIFKCASKLQRHHLIHTGEKPFVCLVCRKAFRQAIHLKKHLETHTGNPHTTNPFTGSWGNVDSVSRGEAEPTAYSTDQEHSGFSYTPDVPLQSCVSSEVEDLKHTMQPKGYVEGLNAIEQPEIKLISLDGVINTDRTCLVEKDPTKLILQEHQFNSYEVNNAVSHTDNGLQCTVCLKFFSSPYQLQRHLLVHSRMKPFECSICKQKFRQMAHLKLHSQTHAQDVSSQDVTEVCLIPAAEQVSHCSSSKVKVNHQCPECPKTFCSPSKLRRHCLIHTGQRPFHCIECGKTFRQLAHLKTHQDTHRTVLSVQTPFYEKMTAFPQGSMFEDGNSDKYQPSDSELPSLISPSSHSLQGHTLLEPSQLLNTDFSSNMTFSQRCLQMEQQHEVNVLVPQHIHQWNNKEGQITVKKAFSESNTNCYQCSVCSKSFNFARKLRRHYLTHEKLRPFQCLVCGRTFCQRAHLQKHRCENTNRDEFANQGEGTESDSPPSVQPHQDMTENNDSDQKVTLQAEEVNALDLNIIVKQEQWLSCNNEEQVPAPDDLAFTPECQLQPALDHMKTKYQTLTRKTHQCGTCLKCFPTPSKLQRHILIHTGQRPFGCRVCGKRFRQLAHLMLHNRTHFRPERIKQKRTNVDSDSFPPQIIFDNVSSGSGLNCDVSMQGNNPEHLMSEEPHLRTDLDAPSKSVLDQNSGIHDASFDHVRNDSHVKHQCLLCSKCFSCPSKLQRHHLMHTGQKPFRCFLCGKTFRQAIHLKVHQQTHKWSSFRRVSQQKKVINTDGSDTSIEQYQGSVSGYQEQQVLATEPQSNWPISDCPHQGSTEEKYSDNKSTSSESDRNDLAMHFEINTIVKSEDWISNNNSGSKSRHEGITSSKQCQPELTSNDRVNKCQKVERKTYQCVTCLKCFSTPPKLQRHILTHTGHRPFSCFVCGKKFHQLEHMKFHIRTHNWPRITQQKKKYGDTDLFSLQQIEHDRVSSVTTLESDLTPQNTFQGLELEKPLEMSVDQSVHLENQWDQSNADTSKRSKNYGKHQCLLCFKCFTCPSKLQRHHLIHTGQKPFRCIQCDKTFRQAIHLKIHQQTHNRWRPYRRVSWQEELVNTEISGGSEHLLSSESIYQEKCILTRAPQTDSITSDCLHQETIKDKDPDSDPEMITSEPGGVNELAVKFDQDTVEEPEDGCRSNGDFQSTPDEGKKSIKQCQLQLELENNVNKCQTSPSKQQKHILTHTGQRPFSCYVCRKNFRQLAHMKYHICSHKWPRVTMQEKNEASNLFTSKQVEYDIASSVTTFESDLPLQNTLQNIVLEKPPKISLDQSVPSEKQQDQNNVVTSERNKSHGKHQCLLCFKCFSCPSKLQRHHLIHTGQRPFHCFLCGKTFRQAIHLKVHQQTHNKWRPFRRGSWQNELANTEISSSSGQHLSGYQGNAILTSGTQSEFPTPDCLGTMEDKNEGLDHKMNTPEPGGVNALAVKIDQDTIMEPEDLYPSNDDLQSTPHEATTLTKCQPQLESTENASEKLKRNTYQCLACLKCFSTPSKLQRHILTHTGQRPFSCYVCGKKFRQLVHLKFHIRTHNRARIAKQKKTCEDGYPFSTHKIQYDSVVTTLNSDLPLQKNTPEKGTDEPQKIYLNPSSEEGLGHGSDFVYERNHRNMKHQCLFCSKCFTCPSKLQRHNLIHTGQKPFQCILCGKTFRQAAHLKVHQQTHNEWRAFRRASRQDKIVNVGKSREQHNARCIISSIPQTIKEDITQSQLSSKEATDDICAKKVMLEEIGNPVDVDTNTDVFQNAQCFSAPSQLKSYDVVNLLPRPFQCNICYQTFRQLSQLKTHYNIHLDTSPVQNKVHQKQNYSSVLLERESNYGLEEKAQKVNFTVDQSADLSATPPQNTTIETVAVSKAEKSNSQDHTPQESSDNEGKNTQIHVHYQHCQCNQCFDSSSEHKSHDFSPTGYMLGCQDFGNKFQPTQLESHQQSNNGLISSAKPGGSCNTCQTPMSPDGDCNVQGDSKWSILSHDHSFQNSSHQHCTSPIPTTHEDEQKWDRFAPLNQEESDCVIIEDNSTGRVESPVTKWHATGNSEISHTTKKGYQCPLCSKCFSTSSQLQQHSLIHTENKPFKCPICLKEFVQQSLSHSHQCTYEDGIDSGHCNLNSMRQLEETEQELPVCDYSANFSTTEPVMDMWPVAPDYSSENIKSVNNDVSNPTSLTSTSNIKHTRKAYSCTVCLKCFDTPSKLSRHFLIHTGMKPFKCNVCSKSFRQLCHLQSHQQTHRGKTIRDVHQMNNGHRWDHTEDYPPQNPVSDIHLSAATIPQEAKLRDALHLQDCTSYPLKPSTNHNLAVNDSLDHLTENFDSASVGPLCIIPEVELEIKIKQSKAEHKCSECQKSFSSPSKLERHYLIHAGERPFNCSICDKNFRQAAHLKVHQRVHDKTSDDHSSFSSEILDSGNNRHDSSHSHQMKDLSDSDPIYGMSEDIGEGQESQLAGVEVALEPEPCDEYWCEPLNGLFNCEECNQSFVTERRLNLHKCFSKSNSPDTQSSFYQCAICFKNFKSPSKLKRHYVIHTGQRPFRCSICKKTFTQSGHLKTHQLCHK